MFTLYSSFQFYETVLVSVIDSSLKFSNMFISFFAFITFLLYFSLNSKLVLVSLQCFFSKYISLLICYYYRLFDSHFSFWKSFLIYWKIFKFSFQKIGVNFISFQFSFSLITIFHVQWKKNTFLVESDSVVNLVSTAMPCTTLTDMQC